MMRNWGRSGVQNCPRRRERCASDDARKTFPRELRARRARERSREWIHDRMRERDGVNECVPPWAIANGEARLHWFWQRLWLARWVSPAELARARRASAAQAGALPVFAWEARRSRRSGPRPVPGA